MCFRTQKPIGFFFNKNQKIGLKPSSGPAWLHLWRRKSTYCEAAYGVNRTFLMVSGFLQIDLWIKFTIQNPMWPAGLGASSLGVFHGRLGVQKLDLLTDNLCLLPTFLGLYFKAIKIRSKHKKIKESHNVDSVKLHDCMQNL